MNTQQKIEEVEAIKEELIRFVSKLKSEASASLINTTIDRLTEYSLFLKGMMYVENRLETKDEKVEVVTAKDLKKPIDFIEKGKLLSHRDSTLMIGYALHVLKTARESLELSNTIENKRRIAIINNYIHTLESP